METLTDITNLVMNSGVTIFVLVYFIYRDNKFMTQLNVTLNTLVETVDALKDRMKGE